METTTITYTDRYGREFEVTYSAAAIDDSDTMEELAGRAVVLRTDEAVPTISALRGLIQDIKADLEKDWRRVSEAQTAEELESAGELVRLHNELLVSAWSAHKQLRRYL